MALNIQSLSVPISVDVRLNPDSSAKTRTIRGHMLAYLERHVETFYAGAVDLVADPALASHCLSARVHVPARCEEAGVPFWKANVKIYVYRAYDDVSVESFDADGGDTDGGGDTVASHQYMLPSSHFEGLWENLYFSTQLQDDLVRFAASGLQFAQRGVDPAVVAANRVILLHGPPGTGKTTLCKALAQRLSIRLGDLYPNASQLIEVNSHSLFSKWFSESGKLVSRLFERIEEAAADQSSMVCVLIDEVESLAASRSGASGAGSSEPSDALRSVNALLTQLDRLQRLRNVLVLTTSNITAAIDDAFLDRADVRRYVGPPGARARYEILRTCLAELVRAGVVAVDGACLSTPAQAAAPAAAPATAAADAMSDSSSSVSALAAATAAASVLGSAQCPSAVLLSFDAAIRRAPAALSPLLRALDTATTDAAPGSATSPASAAAAGAAASAVANGASDGAVLASDAESHALSHVYASLAGNRGLGGAGALAPAAAGAFAALARFFDRHPSFTAAARRTVAGEDAEPAADASPVAAAPAGGALPPVCAWLLHAAVATTGLSGRSLRKLPLQAHAFGLPDEFYDDPSPAGVPLSLFMGAVETAAKQRLEG